MRYYANPSTPRIRAAMTAGALGCIVTPKQGNAIPEGARLAADNGCFGKGYPGDNAWFTWLSALPAERVDFAVAPDVVTDAEATLTRSGPWLARIRALGMPAALVAQNGLEHMDVPWDDFDVLFLGGSLECLPCDFVWPANQRPARKQPCPACGRPLAEWKVGAAARQLVAEAKSRGKGVHMGRVNSDRRLRYADAIGCDSADGTYLVFGPDINLPKLTTWLRGIHTQPALTGEFLNAPQETP